MTSEGQFSLFPGRSDQRWSPLHRLEVVAGELADFADGVEAQIGDLVLFEIGPDRLNGIEFRGIGRQARNRNMAVQLYEPGVEFSAAMDGSTIPDDQQRFLDLALEGTEKFDDLLGANGPGKEPEVELREGQTGNGRELLPSKVVFYIFNFEFTWVFLILLRSFNMVLIPVLCPVCGHDKISKRGKMENGKQRYFCQHPECSIRTFILDYDDNGYLPEVKKKIIDMAMNGSRIRDTAEF